MRHDLDDEPEDTDHRRRLGLRPRNRLVQARPLEVRTRALQLILRMRHAQRKIPVVVAGGVAPGGFGWCCGFWGGCWCGVGTSSLDIVWATNAMKSRTRRPRLISFGQVCLHLRGLNCLMDQVYAPSGPTQPKLY